MRRLEFRFIQESPVSIKNVLVAVTDAGRAALDCQPSM
jgi:hypothetical protein